MGIRIVKGWPKTASEKAVKDWMDKKGIDSTNVISYEIFAETNHPSTIRVNMHFDEDEEG